MLKKSAFLKYGKKKLFWAALALIVALALFFWLKGGREKESPKAMPVPVTVTEALLKDMPDDVAAFGQVKALDTVAIQARVTTRIDRVLVQDGQMVKNGQLLFTLDDREFVAAVNQAEANLAHDRAQAEYARLEDQRNQALLKTKTVSQDTYDQAHATYLEALGSVAISEASLAEARLKLEYCRINSPLEGRLGKVMVTAGNLVSENASELVTMHSLRPIRISFFVQESRLGQLRAVMAEKEPPLVFIDPKDGRGKEYTGRLVFMDNQVDPSTGAITVEAEYPNDNLELWPGQYADVRLRLGVNGDALVIPEVAARTGPESADLAAVVGPDNRARLRKIKVVRRVGDLAMVEGDLKAGEKVVMDGYMRLTDGALVEIRK